MDTIKKKTIVDTIKKFNNRVSKKISDTKENNFQLLEKNRRFEESFDNGTYMSGLGSDDSIHKRFLLSIVDYYQNKKKSLEQIIQLKEKVNDNGGKLKVLKSLLGISLEENLSTNKDSSSSKIQSPMLKATSDKTPMLITSNSNEQPSETELEALIQEAEGEKSRLNSSLTTFTSRNSSLGAELTRLNDFLAASKSQNLEQKIEEHKQEIDDIKLEIELLTSS